MDVLILIALLTIPLVAGAGLVLFMASGKGKPAAQTHEILAIKAQKQWSNEVGNSTLPNDRAPIPVDGTPSIESNQIERGNLPVVK